MNLLSRCGARTRQANGCQPPAMPHGRCRMQGGTSPGAPPGDQRAFKHRLYGLEWRNVKGHARAPMEFGRD